MHGQYQQQYAPQYQPQFAQRRWLAQAAPIAAAPVAPAVIPVSSGPSPAAKALTTVVTLGVATTAALVGIREGMKGKGPWKVAGWVGGIGAGLLGLATVVNLVSEPAAKFIMQPYNLPSSS